ARHGEISAYSLSRTGADGRERFHIAASTGAAGRGAAPLPARGRLVDALPWRYSEAPAGYFCHVRAAAAKFAVDQSAAIAGASTT
ncbi:hypothetical protein ABTX81_39365, partial [Kitasatospora sp. NPDC097605]|uniref:hypothetical protein n=1 Tax=Kitasatospora sp. NPDC097605 TaxID=3157226 RepID=UPI003327BF05